MGSMMTRLCVKKLSSRCLGWSALCVLLTVSAQSMAAPAEQFTKLLSTLSELRENQPSACGETLKGMGGQSREGLVPVER